MRNLEGRTAVKTTYHTIRKQGKINEQQLASFLVKNGQALLPMVDLIEQCQLACDELIDVTGRATIQAVLQLSAMEAVGGPPQQGKRRSSDVVFYGRQPGQVMLSDRKLEVERPRLRSKGPRSREVEVPAYAAMQNRGAMGSRMLEILMRGVSTRNYKEVIPAMAETAGVSRSAVSRRVAEASEAEVKALLSRRFDELKLLVIYIDGLVFGDYTMIGAVGVDSEGNKHVLGIREGATENSTVITELLEDIVSRGVDPKRKMLFVIDGSKALRAAINAVFGTQQPVQRCRAHKLRNVLDYLPKDQRAQTKSVLRAAWKLGPKEGMARVKKLAAWLDQQYPSAAASLMEGLEECFTINRLDLPPSLHRCLATTNIIESPHAGVRIQTRRVTHWQNGKMVLRWMASAFIRTEKRFNKIMGHRDLWALEAILNPSATASQKAA
ncbi:IS256 family transposase [Edaphobacter sp.]|uniref:IS256 family transposase n=1 Tax=Edaphobacter sp. TaxID=1934404 RepID=UPI002D80D2F0|nr:IS256 family transposase [Edaphobacter sp.]